jgi:hypothetical protein
VALDMQRVSVSLTEHWRRTKVFNRLKAENGSACALLSLAQKAKLPRCNVVNAGKLIDFGNNGFSLQSPG